MKLYPNIIAGNHVQTEEVLDIVDPFTGQIIGTTCWVGKDEVAVAIDEGVRALKIVKNFSSYEREEALKTIASAIQSKKDELANLIVLECAKPYKYALGEVERAIQTFQIAAEETKRLPKEYIDLDWTPSGKKKEGFIKYFPIGVIVGITPFNFPLNLVAHKVAPAIAAGCPIIIKPSPKAPLSAIELGKIIANSNLPSGMISVLNIRDELVKEMCHDEGVKMISFTGSPEVGWGLKGAYGDKKITLELGGNAGVLIAADADITSAVSKCVGGAFAYSGQVCIHTQRIYVQETIFDEFVNQFVLEAANLKFGDPANQSTDISVMIDEENSVRVENWVNESIAGGAKLLIGGKRKGAFFPPTVLTNTKINDKVCSEEVFGPVVVIEKYTDLEEGFNQLNNSKYGLQAGVFTNDIQLTTKAFNELEVGGVIVNDVPTFRVDHMPYGGVKKSGFGREGVKYAIREMMEPKILVKETE